MAVTLVKERWQSRVGEVVLGATPEQGGTRSHTITVGGDGTLPFLQFEGTVVNRPVIALEVQDVEPEWNPLVKEYFADVINDPAADHGVDDDFIQGQTHFVDQNV